MQLMHKGYLEEMRRSAWLLHNALRTARWHLHTPPRQICTDPHCRSASRCHEHTAAANAAGSACPACNKCAYTTPVPCVTRLHVQPNSTSMIMPQCAALSMRSWDVTHAGNNYCAVVYILRGIYHVLACMHASWNARACAAGSCDSLQTKL